MSERRRGRPVGTRSAEPSSVVAARIPNRYHDRLSRIAVRHGVSLSKVVRRAIFVFLRDESTGPRTN